MDNGKQNHKTNIMTKDEVKAFLREKPGYLKEGAARLSEKLNCSVETCKHAFAK